MSSGATSTSTGTSGIGPGSGGGLGEAVGQRRHSLMRSLRTSVPGSKGAAIDGSIAVSVLNAAASRSAGLACHDQGNRTSSQSVAA